MRADIIKDISYASSAGGRGGAAVIRFLENATGRLSLLRRAAGYEADVQQGDSFWQVLPRRYGLNLEVTRGKLGNIPADGPVILVANHPYGILDGLMMGSLLDQVRGDFRILANSVFLKADALNRVVLPISFDENKESVRLNIATKKAAHEYLSKSGAIGVFPGGTVSTSVRPFSRPMDPGWRNFTAKMIAKSDATVVPIFFEGHNSRLFQIASHLHANLRLGLLIKEFRARVDEPVRIAIGEPISPSALGHLKSDPCAVMDFLRRATYALSPDPQQPYDLGYEFEAKYRSR